MKFLANGTEMFVQWMKQLLETILKGKGHLCCFLPSLESDLTGKDGSHHGAPSVGSLEGQERKDAIFQIPISYIPL